MKVKGLAFIFVLLAWACSDDEGNGQPDGDANQDLSDLDEVTLDTSEDLTDLGDEEIEEEELPPPIGLPPGTGETFAAFCTDHDWDEDLTDAIAGELGGSYGGYYSTLPEGTLETMMIIPEHPFKVTSFRVAFAGVGGQVRLRLMRSFGRSYPDLENPEGDLMVPIERDIEDPVAARWLEIDVSDQDIFLLPTEHYVMVYEHLSSGPYLAVEGVTEGDYSRGLMLVPGEDTPYGVDGNYRMNLGGYTFCEWDDSDRWFEEDSDQPFLTVASQRAAIADLNTDGHDDLVVNAGGPQVYLGDGTGDFAFAGTAVFADALNASMVVFGDLDNDGDQDAFTVWYVNGDGDGDGVSIAEGDCNDTAAGIEPGNTEIAGNGIDDDCDGTADDGTSTADSDLDGVTIADGDCDDTLNTVYAGAPELLDGRDNNCDGRADEAFAATVLLNDGTGRFTRLPDAGVGTTEPTAAAALGDGNEDGNLDVYWGNWLRQYPKPPAVPDHYATGNGDGTFTEASEAAGVVLTSALPCYGVAWTDYNNDGHQDIWVGNYGYEPNLLWHNNGDGTFTQMGSTLGIARDEVGRYGGNTFGGDWGDFDNDGDLDLYAANIAHPRYQPWSDPSVFHVNQGAPDYQFINQREELGLVYDEGDVNAAFADFDNDMDLDLFVASLYTGHFSRLYQNNGAAGFSNVTYQTTTAVNDSVSPVWSDVDEDGDLDLIVADRTGPEYVHLFINRVGQDKNWLQLVLEGTETNRDAIGARVTLTAGGVTQIREVKGGQGHSNTQSTHVVHFGLADVGSIDEVTVRWVGGDTETVTGLEPNGRYRVVEGSGAGTLLD